MTAFFGGSPNLSVLDLPQTEDPFEIPTVPAPSLGTTMLLKPHWTALASGVDPYRPWVSAILDGVAYFANGFDQAWYADVATKKFWPLGSVAPTSFAVNDAGSGTTFPLGMTLKYFLVFRNPAMGEETAPQPTADAGGLLVAGVTHTMVATKSAVITWDSDEIPERFPKVRIYRELQNSNAVVLIAEVDASTETYTDTTTDANVSTLIEDAYTPRYRLDLPPRFKGLAAFQGKLIGFTGLDANLYYGQTALPTGEFVTSDFPAANIAPIEPDDGFGEITAVVAHYDLLLVFKRRGCYSVTDFESGIPVVTRMFGDKGCLGPRCVISVFDALVFLDEGTLYSWLTSAEPVVIGAQAGVGSPYAKGHLAEPSPLAPLWKRLNLDAADMMHLVHNEALGYVEAWVALDSSPIANRRVRVYYRKDRYESVDCAMVQCAGGVLFDGVQTPYLVGLDELGILRQMDVGDSVDVYAGATALPVSQVIGQTVSFVGGEISTDDLLGPLGAPIDHIGPTGLVVDENRIVDVPDSDHLTLLRWYDAVDQGSDSYAWGVVRDLWAPAHLDFMTGDYKFVDHVVVEFDPQLAGSVLRVDTTVDARDFVRRREIDMTLARGWAIVPCFDRGYKWRSRFSSRFAGYGYSVRALRIDWRAHRKRQ